jgi:ABC-type glycerol-3-phosphate transport system substrate-binding protein
MEAYHMFKRHIISGLLAITVSMAASASDTANKFELEEAKEQIDAFLQKYDGKTIDNETVSALEKDSDRKPNKIVGLPPRTPELFASGLFMPFTDDMGMYHSYDHIYFKVKDGRWDLDSKEQAHVKNGFLFTREEGL